MSRPSLFSRAMTGAERVRRHRAAKNAARFRYLAVTEPSGNDEVDRLVKKGLRSLFSTFEEILATNSSNYEARIRELVAGFDEERKRAAERLAELEQERDRYKQLLAERDAC